MITLSLSLYTHHKFLVFVTCSQFSVRRDPLFKYQNYLLLCKNCYKIAKSADPDWVQFCCISSGSTLLLLSHFMGEDTFLFEDADLCG